MTSVLITPDQAVVIGGATVATTAYLRLFLILGSVAGLLLALVDAAAGTRRDVPAVTLGILGAARPRAGPAGSARSRCSRPRPVGCSGSCVTAPWRWRPGRRSVGLRELRAIVDRRRPGDRRDGLDRPRPERARGPAGRLRPGLPRVRARGRDPVRGDPVPPLGGPRADAVPEAAPAAPDRLGPGRVRRRRPRLDRRIGRAAARRRSTRRAGPGPRPSASRRSCSARGRLDPGRPRARRRLLDRRRRRGRRCSASRRSTRRPGRRPDLDPRLRRGAQRLRRLGRRARTAAFGRGRLPSCAAGPSARRSWSSPSSRSSSPAVGWPGSRRGTPGPRW